MFFSTKQLEFPLSDRVQVSQRLKSADGHEQISVVDLVERIISSQENPLIFAPRGLGKTSILNEIAYRVNSANGDMIALDPVSISTIYAPNKDDAYSNLIARLCNPLRNLYPNETIELPSEFDKLLTVLDSMSSQVPGRITKFLILLDDCDAINSKGMVHILEDVGLLMAKSAGRIQLVGTFNFPKPSQEALPDIIVSKTKSCWLDVLNDKEVNDLIKRAEDKLKIVIAPNASMKIQVDSGGILWFIEELLAQIELKSLPARTVFTLNESNDMSVSDLKSLMFEFARPLSRLSDAERGDMQEVIKELIETSTVGNEKRASKEVYNLQRWGLARPNSENEIVCANALIAKWFSSYGPVISKLFPEPRMAMTRAVPPKESSPQPEAAVPIPEKVIEHPEPEPKPLPKTSGKWTPDGTLKKPEECWVWFGTNRALVAQDNPNKGFANQRDPDGTVRYGECLVHIPRAHKLGSLGKPWWQRLFRPDDRLKLGETNLFDSDNYFLDALSKKLKNWKEEEQIVLVYLHGYNTSFTEAARRAAQLKCDLEVRGETAFYSWPSMDIVEGYDADQDRVDASEKQIADFLTLVATKANAKSVHIIAHSMGNRGLARAISRATLYATATSNVRFGQIILAAPDIDVDLFKELAVAYPKVSERTTMYVCGKDKPLAMSKWLQDSDRAGFTPPVTVLDGIDTVEVTNIDLTFLGHDYYAEASPVIDDMKDLIRNNTPPDKREQIKAKSQAGAKFWEMREQNPKWGIFKALKTLVLRLFQFLSDNILALGVWGPIIVAWGAITLVLFALGRLLSIVWLNTSLPLLLCALAALFLPMPCGILFGKGKHTKKPGRKRT